MSRLYDKKEMARFLKCSVSKIEKMMKAGEIEFEKIGSLVRFRESTVVKFTGTPLSPEPVSIRNSEPEVVESTVAYGALRDGRQ